MFMATTNMALIANSLWEDHKEEAYCSSEVEVAAYDHYGLHPDSKVWCFYAYGRRRWGCCPLLVEVSRQQFYRFSAEHNSAPFPSTGLQWAYARELRYEDDCLFIDLQTGKPVYGKQALPERYVAQ